MIAIEQAIKAALTAAAGVPVFLLQAPQEQPSPFVVFRVASRAELPGSAPLETLTISIAVVDPNHAHAEQLAEAIAAALTGYRYGAPKLRLGPLARANEDSSLETEWNEHRVSLVYSAPALVW